MRRKIQEHKGSPSFGFALSNNRNLCQLDWNQSRSPGWPPNSTAPSSGLKPVGAPRGARARKPPWRSPSCCQHPSEFHELLCLNESERSTHDPARLQQIYLWADGSQPTQGHLCGHPAPGFFDTGELWHPIAFPDCPKDNLEPQGSGLSS